VLNLQKIIISVKLTKSYKHVQVKIRATKGINVDKKVTFIMITLLVNDYTDLKQFLK